ncbi:MAG: hypothetical protein ACYC22_05775 [Thiomonas delicata]
MSPSHGRPKTDETPHGGVVRSAGVPTLSPSHGRPKTDETPHGGVVRSAGVPR